MKKALVRSRHGHARVALAACIALALPLVVACNSILGLTDFEKGECPGARCGDGGDVPDVLAEGGRDVLVDAPPDVRGADPVSWAKWPMPNYGDGGAATAPRPQSLLVAGNTVTDQVTELVWHRTLVPGDPTAAEVNAACQGLPNGPWRAPKRIELVTLLDHSRASTPFVDNASFPDLKNFKVWTTSEVRPFQAGKADQPYWVVNFDTGAVEPLAGNLSAKVLCVRAK